MAETLLSDVIGMAHTAAEQVKFVTADIINVFTGLREAAERRNQYSSNDPRTRKELINNGFQAIVGKLNEIKDDKRINSLSRLTALDTLVANAVSNAEQTASFAPPQEQIRQFLTDYLNRPENHHNKSAAVDQLGKKLETLLISLVHTMHPTIYHTAEARHFEEALKGVLEQEGNLLKASGGNSIGLSDAGQQALWAFFTKGEGQAFIQKLESGAASISPKQQVTVAQETQAERHHFAIIREELEAVIAAWNEAVKSPIRDVNIASLTISPERAQKMLELRTWGQSADADGREKSTSQYLHRCIRKNLKEADKDMPADVQYMGKIYAGQTLDMRQNAKKVHLPYISALFQVKLRNSESRRYFDPEQKGEENGGKSFADYCHEFMDEAIRKQKYEARKNGNGGSWQGPRHSLFQQLDEEDRTEFLNEVIKRGYDLVPDQMRSDTLAFLTGEKEPIYLEHTNPFPPGVSPLPDGISGIEEIREAFLARYAAQIRKAKANPEYDPNDIDYKEMIDVTIPYDLNKPDGEQVSLRGAWDAVVKLNGWEILHSGLQYSRLMAVKPPEPPILDFWNHVTPKQILVQNFLQGTKKPSKPGSEEPFEDLTEQERATFNDTIKRLFVINDAIVKYGSKVADRYQIANFSEPADFLILLKLFEEAGIAEIEKGTGKVLKTKMGIMPLLETGEDLRNARAIFSKLLNNSIAASFWEARGKALGQENGVAEIMLGFSDGAASVGNFASQWEIYKASRDLTELFAEKGIKVRFFQGRGRGTDRGGTIDPRLQMDLMSPQVMQSGIYDVTLQSDLPMDLAASRAYGQDYFTKILLGTLNASLTAEPRIKDQDNLKQMEADIDWIANRSAQIYQEIVRTNNPNGALKIINKGSDNDHKASRAPARGGEKEKKIFDDVRAIPKEYLFNGIDLPLHNVGLATALNEFERDHGRARITALNNHPFFKAMLKTITAGMVHYDPAVAKAHAKTMDSEKLANPEKTTAFEMFMKKVFVELNSLIERLNIDSHHRPSWSSVLDQIGHAIIVKLIADGKPVNPNVNRSEQALAADTIYNAVFTTRQQIGHRDLPEREVVIGRAA